jgi:DNA-binding Xre family transcriptional regulator
MVSIGKIIEKVVREKRFPITEFAQKINTNRNNVYDIFRRDTIDTGLLQKICEVLEHNFFIYLLTDVSIAENGADSISLLNAEIMRLNKRIEELEKELKITQSQLKDKEMIIELMRK